MLTSFGVCDVIAVRVKRSGSWLDHECSGLLGWKLGQRLWQRCQGRRGVFVTLTYRRDEWQGPFDLYRSSGEQQHVPLFLRRLARAVGESFTGKWICKAEFQRGGWLHFHLIILDVEKIPFETLLRCWGHGGVRINRLRKERVMYLCKYVSKGGQTPAFLLGEAPRSVKIIRTSPGFWHGSQASPARMVDPGAADYRKWGPPPPQTFYRCYRPIGVGLRQGRGVVIRSRCGTWSKRCDPGEFLCRLALVARGCDGKRRGWSMWRATHEEAENAAAACCEHRNGPGVPERSSLPPRSGGLYLIQTRNPDAIEWPSWLVDIWRQDAEAREVCWGEVCDESRRR